jgi:glutamate dehydrogenase/leucine dehydrogenase
MLAATAERASFEEIIVHEYGLAAAQLDIAERELLEAFAPSRTDYTEGTLVVNGIAYSSFRHQVGVENLDDRSRGGCELSPGVTGEKIGDKAVTMHAKHMLHVEEEPSVPGNVGGKSGICADKEEIQALNDNPGDRRKLFEEYTIAHGINPRTNIVATDIGTFGRDMDAVADALVPEYGNMAGAAASGASEQYGGAPELHAPHTGAGASIVLDTYLREQASVNPRIAEAINGGAPLRAAIQGLGKAGAYALRTLPEYVQPVAVLERNGAMVATGLDVLDRKQTLLVAQATQLDEASVGQIDGTKWLPPQMRSDFWAAGNPDILIPAFDHHQITGEDADVFSENGGIVVASVANHPLDDGAKKILAERRVDELPDSVTNSGGTVSSELIWRKIMYPQGWTPERFEQEWQRKMHRVANLLLNSRIQAEHDNSRFVPLEEAIKAIVVERAVARLRHSSLRG